MIGETGVCGNGLQPALDGAGPGTGCVQGFLGLVQMPAGIFHVFRRTPPGHLAEGKYSVKTLIQVLDVPDPVMADTAFKGTV